MKITDSFNVQIWCGLRLEYTDRHFSIEDVRRICDKYVNNIGDCVTITSTEYRYVGGSEDGVMIGYINYPRFPRTNEEILKRAIDLAKLLKKELCQNRVSVVAPDKTYMLEE
jgi:hypothetical protein